MSDEIYQWEEVKDAVNRIYAKHMGLKGRDLDNLDYVKDICINALPHAIIQVLAMECVLGGDSPDLHIVKCAYKQLQKDGYIGSGK